MGLLLKNIYERLCIPRAGCDNDYRNSLKEKHFLKGFKCCFDLFLKIFAENRLINLEFVRNCIKLND